MACHDVLDKQNEFPERPERWYHELEFVVGTPMADGTEGAAVLKPDIMGGNGISKLEGPLFWKPPTDQLAHQAMLPVGAGNCWRKMVAHAATYARSLFGANPMRVFALILGFNRDNNQLRFLVFHRGGLAASHPYDLTQEDGLKEVARLLLTLASWRTAADAGFITCGDDTTHLLPVDKEGEQHVRATVKEIIFRSPCVRGRMTQVFLLLLPTNAPPADQELKSTTTSREKGKSVSGEQLPGPATVRSGLETGSSENVPSLSKVLEQTKGGNSSILVI
ncbi:hypothetical protein BJ322DRAFT_652705 [Thelephora terrestris]|uniref:Fungal-type protein kinase domain-containing protein n=1 Tax=Thelephora terrestris TaxID=56493 RepID=A0A9P6HLL0_9AGAM|nr:hypothetical protein BJ322DRAFT_652705 [Thelephora terrestris]